mmetsp:Transcript_25696/g.52627  ORF Transcript_25696/g.52627 Transcript_25696/m.52627 type:complete len:243 (+) Transcript_25696:237-965(+)
MPSAEIRLTPSCPFFSSLYHLFTSATVRSTWRTPGHWSATTLFCPSQNPMIASRKRERGKTLRMLLRSSWNVGRDGKTTFVSGDMVRMSFASFMRLDRNPRTVADPPRICFRSLDPVNTTTTSGIFPLSTSSWTTSSRYSPISSVLPPSTPADRHATDLFKRCDKVRAKTRGNTGPGDVFLMFKFSSLLASTFKCSSLCNGKSKTFSLSKISQHPIPTAMESPRTSILGFSLEKSWSSFVCS